MKCFKWLNLPALVSLTHFNPLLTPSAAKYRPARRSCSPTSPRAASSWHKQVTNARAPLCAALWKYCIPARCCPWKRARLVGRASRNQFFLSEQLGMMYKVFNKVRDKYRYSTAAIFKCYGAQIKYQTHSHGHEQNSLFPSQSALQEHKEWVK